MCDEGLEGKAVKPPGSRGPRTNFVEAVERVLQMIEPYACDWDPPVEQVRGRDND